MKKTIIGIMLLLIMLLTAACGKTAEAPKETAGTEETAENTQAVDAKSLGLADGNYEVSVTLEGGSGKSGVESPASLRIEDGQAFATITWSSPNYDYMKVDDEKYDTVNTDGNSVFEIPVSEFDCKMPVIADTIAMSTPHEIEYTLYFDSSTISETK